MTSQIKYEQLDKYSIVEKLSALQRKGWWWDTNTGKITCRAGFDWNSVWVHIRKEPHKRCRLYHEIIFGLLDAFPTFCLNCWKVVARPTTIEQMIDICLPAMRELDLPSKLGVAPRRNTFGLYQCYFYNNSLEQAKQTEGIVKSAFGPEIEVFTKRYCSEFEQTHGPSNTFQPQEHHAEITAIIEELVDFPVGRLLQPRILQEHIIKNEWLITASQAGDKTVSKYFENSLHVECIRY